MFTFFCSTKYKVFLLFPNLLTKKQTLKYQAFCISLKNFAVCFCPKDDFLLDMGHWDFDFGLNHYVSVFVLRETIALETFLGNTGFEDMRKFETDKEKNQHPLSDLRNQIVFFADFQFLFFMWSCFSVSDKCKFWFVFLWFMLELFFSGLTTYASEETAEETWLNWLILLAFLSMPTFVAIFRPPS